MDSLPVQSAAAPVIVVKRGVLSSNAAAELRKAGYRVIFSSDPAAIKVFGAEERFKEISNAAKIKAFDFMLGSANSNAALFSKNDMRTYYVHYMKEGGNF